MKEFIKENLGVIYVVATGVLLIGIVTAYISTSGKEASYGVFDGAIDRIEAELESDGE